ncbi:PQQ-dependent sugar dehydrogenase [Anaeromyxobacter sp. SG66]|uniref:PQQ-dependent sugar dehydrogenase n=1 Tax=Anaeromyxobacter sp. SG66 TaxID=2925410 RepID=UPI001F573629|nr:PQQ-dependent sugar dehydrogenase [Anaeromyxobacter sp. SG66]
MSSVRPGHALPLLAVLLAVPLAARGARPPGDAARGATLFRERCALCHGEGGGRGPDLEGVVGRRAGSAPGFGFSHGLRDAGARGLTWSARTLDRYLAAPGKLVGGTTMSLATPGARDRRDLVAYLATLSARRERAAPSAESASGAPAPAPPDAGAGRTPQAAPSGDWRGDAPGVRHRLTADRLPRPNATPSARRPPRVVDPPRDARLRAPSGFAVERFAEGLEGPRLLRVAPNGDLFVAETAAGRVRVIRAAQGAARPERVEVFASDLDGPFGIAFHPPGAEPRWVYVATENAVVRFPYRSGDLTARGRPETIVPRLADTDGGHTTRDVAFSPDGRRMFVSVGSASNVAEDLPRKTPEALRAWEAEHGLGAAWGEETWRADVLAFDAEGRNRRPFATGLRNCVGLAVHPRTGDLWCTVNERDGLGDDLVPDYVTRVREGAFYGWPWLYLGQNEDPRHRGARPDLASKATVPDVLLQAHSAALGLAFYEAPQGAAARFPDAWTGDAFVALHGSWNRRERTGYKVVRMPIRDGVPAGEYEDFLTGFVVDDARVWGRPVGVAVARDGALLVSEDGNGTIWRIVHVGAR